MAAHGLQQDTRICGADRDIVAGFRGDLCPLAPLRPNQDQAVQIGPGLSAST